MTDAPILLSSGPLRRVGGALAVDFVNTIDWRLRPKTEERLLSFDDLLAWAAGTGALDRKQARRLSARAKAEPAAAERVLQRACRMREALFRLLLAEARRKSAARADLDLVNRWLAGSAPRDRLERVGSHLSWRQSDPATLESVLDPVLWSAGDLLAVERAASLKLCAAPGCGWLFLDASRKASRLWCSMESCGNRAKAQRHYRRLNRS